MNRIKSLLTRIDAWQQKHRFAAFSYAVIKKYGEDQAGHQAALVTYYGFLSLFPLLLVLTTVTTLLHGSHPEFQRDIIKSTTDYFPVLGNQLSSHTHSLHKSGLALLVGILFTLYGTRGVADAFRNGVNHIWWIPLNQRVGFPKSILKSLTLIIVGGVGFITASVIAGFAASVGHLFVFRAISIGLNIFILFWLFSFLLNTSLPSHISLKEVRSGALAAAVALVILQAVGGFVLAREVKNLDALYSYFALALGLLFWIYLQTQAMFYAVEIASVRTQKAWPRSILGPKLTAADKRAKEHLALQA